MASFSEWEDLFVSLPRSVGDSLDSINLDYAESEPNNSFSSADLISPGEIKVGFIGRDSYEKDYYKVPVTSGGGIKFAFGMAVPYARYFEEPWLVKIFDSEFSQKQALIFNSGGPSDNLTTSVSIGSNSPGFIYVEVTNPRDLTYDVYYLIPVDVGPVELEGNNSIQTANSIRESSVITAHLSSTDDKDFFKLSNPDSL